VVRALAALGGHPDAETVHAEVSRSSGTHRATTYRTLEHLVHLGLVTHLHAGHGPTRYHLSAQVSGHDHLHAVCSGCGDVHDLAPDLLDAVAGELAGAGFRLDPRHVALSGRCERC
jgi:Fur family transcriptional regulator, ferric uptake regulator